MHLQKEQFEQQSPPHQPSSLGMTWIDLQSTKTNKKACSKVCKTTLNFCVSGSKRKLHHQDAIDLQGLQAIFTSKPFKVGPSAILRCWNQSPVLLESFNLVKIGIIITDVLFLGSWCQYLRSSFDHPELQWIYVAEASRSATTKYYACWNHNLCCRGAPMHLFSGPGGSSNINWLQSKQNYVR